jgi:tRNA(Ile)-lysidine synthase TilS/MesJ
MIKVIKEILPKDRLYHFAVSMGVDSVAAIHYLKTKGYNLIPLHFNHNLRYQNVIMAEKFLEFCNDLGLSGHIGVGKNLLTENDCRNARLSFYGQVAENGRIITAHHINDWVENYLLNCFRGQPNNDKFPLVSRFGFFSVLHPFLLSRKKDFKQYVDRNHLMKYIVEDETNSIIKGSRRNWIRNFIIPNMTQNKLSLERFAKREIIASINELNQLT